MSLPRIVQTSSGMTLRLGQQIGKGGEGVVFSVEGRRDIAAKIYHQHLSAERQPKILAMAAMNWHASIAEVAFPIEALFGSGGVFAGFTMKLVGGRRPIHEAYSPTSRKRHFPKAMFPFLVRLALNIANAVAKVHATGCVIGDINHSGVLVSDDATITLIDSDSFQFQIVGKLFPCKVGVPEFTAPELQAQSLGKALRSPNQDNFGLAVLIFYILFMGRHPFSGRPTQGDPPEIGEAIKRFRFAYSSRTIETQMEPPPHVPTLNDLPPQLRQMFERAFGSEGVSSGRASASDWVTALGEAEKQLTKCGASHAHLYFQTAPSCPWCRMEAAIPGFAAFPSHVVMPTTGYVNVSQFLAAIQAAIDPGPPPDLASLMPVVDCSRSGDVSNALTQKFQRIGLGIFGLVVALYLIFSSAMTFIWLFVLGVSAALALSEPANVAAIRLRIAAARSEWSKTSAQWLQIAANDKFKSAKSGAEKLVLQLKALPSEEQRRLKELDAKRRDAQMKRYLEGHLIKPAKIKGLGNVRKIRLQSYGVESAADIISFAIRRVPGCAPLVDSLTAWRGNIEGKFVFNLSIGVDPTEIAAVKSDIARKRVDFEAQTRTAISMLQRTVIEAEQLRTNPRPADFAAWTALKQAGTDEAALVTGEKNLPSVIGAIAACVSVATIIGLTRHPTERVQPHPTDKPAYQAPLATPNLLPDNSSSVEVASIPPKLAAVPVPESATWTRREIGSGRFEMVLKDPSHPTVSEIVVSCSLSGRVNVRMELRSNVWSTAILIRPEPASRDLLTLENGQAGERESELLIARFSEASGAKVGPATHILVEIGTPINLLPFQVPPSVDLAALRDLCRASHVGAISPLPPSVGAPTMPSEIIAPSIPINQPLNISPPSIGPSPQSKALKGRSRQSPSSHIKQPYDRDVGSGTGGLY